MSSSSGWLSLFNARNNTDRGRTRRGGKLLHETRETARFSAICLSERGSGQNAILWALPTWSHLHHCCQEKRQESPIFLADGMDGSASGSISNRGPAFQHILSGRRNRHVAGNKIPLHFAAKLFIIREAEASLLFPLVTDIATRGIVRSRHCSMEWSTTTTGPRRRSRKWPRMSWNFSAGHPRKSTINENESSSRRQGSWRFSCYPFSTA